MSPAPSRSQSSRGLQHPSLRKAAFLSKSFLKLPLAGLRSDTCITFKLGIFTTQTVLNTRYRPIYSVQSVARASSKYMIWERAVKLKSSNLVLPHPNTISTTKHNRTTNSEQKPTMGFIFACERSEK